MQALRSKNLDNAATNKAADLMYQQCVDYKQARHPLVPYGICVRKDNLYCSE